MTLAARRNDLAATSRRNAEVLVAMGMSGRLTKRWSEANEKYLAGNQRASDVAGGLGAIAKVMRMMLQSAVLAVGAYLVIHQEATAGIIIAGSILSARALAPVDLAIAHWKGFVAARQSWHRLNRLLETHAGADDADPAAEPVEAAVGRGRQHRAAGRSAGHRAGRQLSRSRPATASASSGRAVRANRRWCARWSASGSRSAARCGSMARRSISGRPTCSAATSAICRRTSNCSRGTVAQNICRFDPDAKSDAHHRRRQGSRRARHDHQDARRLRHPDRRAGHRAFGRPGAARGAGAGAVRRSVPDRARRAELQSRYRRRRGADPRGSRRARARRHRGGGRAPADRHRGGRSCCWC